MALLSTIGTDSSFVHRFEAPVRLLLAKGPSDKDEARRLDGYPSPPLTPITSGHASSEVESDDDVASHEASSTLTTAPGQRIVATDEITPLFSSFIEQLPRPIESGWARFENTVGAINYNFRAATKARYGESLTSTIKITFSNPRPPQGTESRVIEETNISPQASSSSTTEVSDSQDSARADTLLAKPAKSGDISTKKKSYKVASLQDKLEWILPKDTIHRLIVEPKRCVADIKNPNRRCKRKPKRPFETTNDVRKAIPNYTADHEDESVLCSIRQFMRRCLCECGQWHLKGREQALTEIYEELNRMAANERTELRIWFKTLFSIPLHEEEDMTRATGDAAIPAAVRSVVQQSSYTGPVTRLMSAALANSLPNLRQNHIQKWEPYRPSGKTNRTSSESIRMLLQRDLLPSERKPGYIYMYWYPPNFGYLKIGLTTRTPEVRFKEWEKQCQHPVEDANRQSRFVKHVALVEKLLHAELDSLRFWEMDCVCGKKHKEWFKITPDQAAKVLDKFALYVDQEPYELTHGASGEKYRPKKGLIKENMDELCQLVDISSPKQLVGPRRSPRRQSSHRRRSSAAIQRSQI